MSSCCTFRFIKKNKKITYKKIQSFEWLDIQHLLHWQSYWWRLCTFSIDQSRSEIENWIYEKWASIFCQKNSGPGNLRSCIGKKQVLQWRFSQNWKYKQWWQANTRIDWKLKSEMKHKKCTDRYKQALMFEICFISLALHQTRWMIIFIL